MICCCLVMWDCLGKGVSGRACAQPRPKSIVSRAHRCTGMGLTDASSWAWEFLLVIYPLEQGYSPNLEFSNSQQIKTWPKGKWEPSSGSSMALFPSTGLCNRMVDQSSAFSFSSISYKLQSLLAQKPDLDASPALPHSARVTHNEVLGSFCPQRTQLKN